MVKFMNSCSLASSNNDAFCNNLCILFITVAALCSKSGKGVLKGREEVIKQVERKEELNFYAKSRQMYHQQLLEKQTWNKRVTTNIKPAIS